MSSPESRRMVSFPKWHSVSKRRFGSEAIHPLFGSFDQRKPLRKLSDPIGNPYDLIDTDADCHGAIKKNTSRYFHFRFLVFILESDYLMRALFDYYPHPMDLIRAALSPLRRRRRFHSEG